MNGPTIQNYQKTRFIAILLIHMWHAGITNTSLLKLRFTMLVQEKTRHINATLTGDGLEVLRQLITQYMPDAVITDDESSVEWEGSELCRHIRTLKTPGKLLRAYRERAGLSLVELAEQTGIKYTNISAMEHDTRSIGLAVAKKFAGVLGCHYSALLDRA